MITLKDNEKQIVVEKVKPLLKKGKGKEVVKVLMQEGGYGRNVMCWLMEHGVNILGGMERIPNDFFDGRKISQVVIPSTIKYIGEGAFEDCAELVKLTIEPGVKEISDAAFRNTKIAKVVIPDTIESLGDYVFAYCSNLLEVYLPDSVTYLPEHIFQGCPDSLTIFLNSRKGMPDYLQLRVPKTQGDWYKKHVQIKR